MVFWGLHRIPFAFYRSGTSRGLFLCEHDLPPLGPARDAILCQLMGSGHPQQLGGFGGGTGPTSKIAVVGSHKDPGSVTFSFAQCGVEEPHIDKSHGDCGNMLAAVAPFALERRLPTSVEFVGDGTVARLKIHSLNTGARYEADVCTTQPDENGDRHVQYLGSLEIPGAPGRAAPVGLASVGVAGSQTGKLLPTASPVDVIDFGLGHAEVTLVDFARALVIVNAADILPKFGYTSLQQLDLDTAQADTKLCDALETLRRQASQVMGMGDCSGKDAPKLGLVSPAEVPDVLLGGALAFRYFVNPGRAEMHPTVAMTAAQAIGAACLIQDSVAMKALGKVPESDATDRSSFSFVIQHAKGNFPVSIGTDGTALSSDTMFPFGTPYAGKYRTTVMPIAEGTAFVNPTQ
eukprot:s1194_g11.t1